MGRINQHMDVTIVIPVHNQLRFTRQCLGSLNAAGYADTRIVVVDNASTDGTAEFLGTRPALRVITNVQNRACAAAWNQGFQASATRWTVFLNNDTVSPPGWLESLIAFSERNGMAVTSPAMSEGELDYDLNTFAQKFTARMKNVARRGTASGAFLWWCARCSPSPAVLMKISPEAAMRMMIFLCACAPPVSNWRPAAAPTFTTTAA